MKDIQSGLISSSMAVTHPEPAIERGHQAEPTAARYVHRRAPVAVAGILRPRPERELEQPLVHRDDAGVVRGVPAALPHVRLEHRGDALDREGDLPDALSG